jgi:FkbM family methyltransferase
MLLLLARAILRAELRGSTRLTLALARRFQSLQSAPVSFAGLPPVRLDLRQPVTHEWLRGAVPESWEAGGREVMRRYVRPGDVAFDIGANHGFHTAHLSRLVGPRGRVFAFEPNPSLGSTLAETCRDFGNAEFFNFALDIQSGALDFFVPEDHTMGSLRNWTGLKTSRVRVEVRRLDSLQLPQPAFIKCDVEGAELGVFEGGRDILDREDAPVIMFEACAKSVAAFGRGVSGASSFLTSLARPRYSLYLIEPLSGALSPVTSFDFDFADLLALPASRRDGP